MPRKGTHCVRGDMTDEACRACIRESNGVTPCHVPAPFLEMMRGGEVDYDDDSIDHNAFTPSRLLGCFRQPVLMDETDYYTNVEHNWAAVRGTLIHSGAERVPWTHGHYDKIIHEVRMHTTIETKAGPQKFSGKADLILVTDRGDHLEVDIWDWKTREYDKSMTAAERNHQAQVWMYAWLATQTVGIWWDKVLPVTVRSVNIAYLSSSGSRIFTSLEQPPAHNNRGRGKNRWVEELPLEPIKTVDLNRVGKLIRNLIEAKIRAKDVLPDVLEGEAAKWCFRCPVYGPCYKRAAREERQAA